MKMKQQQSDVKSGKSITSVTLDKTTKNEETCFFTLNGLFIGNGRLDDTGVTYVFVMCPDCLALCKRKMKSTGGKGVEVKYLYTTVGLVWTVTFIGQQSDMLTS